jgi:hypothetical protein
MIDMLILTPEQLEEEKTMNSEALALLQVEDFNLWGEKDLRDIVDQMQVKYNEYHPKGFNCLGIIALRNAASQAIRTQKLATLGI